MIRLELAKAPEPRHVAALREVERERYPAVLAGWWYVRGAILYGSIAGYTGLPVPRATDTSGNVFTYAKDWISSTYRTYWWHTFYYEAPRQSIVFRVPQIAGLVGIVGLARVAMARRGRLRAPDDPVLRQILLLVAAAFAVWLPVMATDMVGRLSGKSFDLTGGRYLLPAYPGWSCSS